MIKNLFENVSDATIAIGILAGLVSVIVEVLKGIMPKSFPTKALVIIVSLLITIISSFIFYDFSVEMIFCGIIQSFIVAYVSMYGFDTLKEIFDRFKIQNNN